MTEPLIDVQDSRILQKKHPKKGNSSVKMVALSERCQACSPKLKRLTNQWGQCREPAVVVAKFAYVMWGGPGPGGMRLCLDHLREAIETEKPE